MSEIVTKKYKSHHALHVTYCTFYIELHLVKLYRSEF